MADDLKIETMSIPFYRKEFSSKDEAPGSFWIETEPVSGKVLRILGVRVEHDHPALDRVKIGSFLIGGSPCLWVNKKTENLWPKTARDLFPKGQDKLLAYPILISPNNAFLQVHGDLSDIDAISFQLLVKPEDTSGFPFWR